jgi:acylphosphatase
VRNHPDGSVEGLFEGEAESVDALVAWCRTGPPAALVERIETRSENYRGEFAGFTITH